MDFYRKIVGSQKMNHEKRRFKCTTCPYEANRSSSLTVHMRRHLGEKHFLCNVCDEAFVTKQELAVHFQSHTEEYPFKCQQQGSNLTSGIS